MEISDRVSSSCSPSAGLETFLVGNPVGSLKVQASSTGCSSGSSFSSKLSAGLVSSTGGTSSVRLEQGS